MRPPRFSLSIIITATLLLLLVIYKSHELIGFIYGPSSQLFATKQQIIQSNLLSRIFAESESITTSTRVSSWMMARIASTAEQIYNPHYELAYQHDEHDCMTCILRDAGVVTAMIAVLRACNFFSDDDNTTTTTTKSLRRWHLYHYLFMAGALFILPGMIGQLLLTKTIPIEILLLNRFNNNTDMSLSGIVEGVMYVGYCSLKSVLGQEGGDGMYFSNSAVYELKVVGVALAFVAFFLGE